MRVGWSTIWSSICQRANDRSRAARRSRATRRCGFELLEARTLLCGGTVGGLATALPIDVSTSIDDFIGVPAEIDYFELSVTEPGRLTVRTESGAPADLDTRTSLWGPGADLIVQSDGESHRDANDLIVQHLLPGRYTLMVEAPSGGAGPYRLTTDFVPAIPPDQPMTVRFDRDYPYSLMPYYHVAGDFNGDGHLDLATANTYTSDVSVLLGLGDGSFQAPQNFAVGLLPFGIVAVDLNGDHRIDIATANQLSNDVSVLLNSWDGVSGSGLFAPAVHSAGGRAAWGLASGDFNGDGRPDLATANLRTNDVSVLVGLGDGTFHEVQDDSGQPLRFPVGEGPNGVTAADLNRDGHIDVVTSNYNSHGLSILQGLGNGKFQEAVTIATGPSPENVLVGDFNRDGHMDLATPSGGSNFITIHWGPWNAGFADDVQYPTGRTPLAVAAGDFDGNGQIDLAAANRTTNDVTVLLGQLDGTYQSDAEYGVGLQPSNILTGDFNGDGWIDLATANARSHDISILVGRGDGTFVQDPARSRQSETNPQGMVARDFNRDGRLDVAGVSYSRGDLFVFLGRGDGTFQERVRFAVGSTPVELVAEDFNRDLVWDLATINCDSGDFSVLLGRGDGTFHDHVRYPSSASGEFGVVGDFDNDGHVDVVVSGQFASGIAITRGHGDGSFGSRVLFALDEAPADGVAGDFNKDGWLDLATTNYFSPAHDISVHLNRGDGSFREPLHFQVGEFPLGIVAGDFNRDGHLDLINSNLTDHSLSLLLGEGGGNFLPERRIRLKDGSLPDFLLASDLNRDGNLDVVVSNAGSHDVSVLYGQGDGRFQEPVQYVVGNGPTPRRGLEVGDFNGDSFLDLAFPQVISNDVAVLLGSAEGRFSAPISFPVGLGPVALVSGDFSGDNRLDVASVNPTTNELTISIGIGDGTLREPESFLVGDAPVSLVQSDFNNDGRLDLATANFASGDVSVLLGLGTGPFRQERRFAVGMNPTSVTTGDFNGDGRLDLATTNSTTADVSVLLGRGDGTFQSQTRFKVGDTPQSLVSGDFNNDGSIDLAVANYRSNDITILPGHGDGTFATPLSLAVGGSPISIYAGDLNRDGRPDLVTANHLSHEISVLLARSDGTFQPATRYEVGTYPVSVVSHDLNGDGHVDVATANRLSDDVSILFGRGDGTFAQAQRHAVGDYPAALVAADFDDDARIDLGIATQLNPAVSILQGLGDSEANFVAAGTLSNPRHATPVVADWNGDGLPDVAVLSRDGRILLRMSRPGARGVFESPVVLNPDSRFAARDLAVISWRGTLIAAVLEAKNPTLSFYTRGPNGDFTRSVGPAVPGALAVDIEAGDLDRNGEDDLVVATAGSNEVYVYFQSATRGSGVSQAFSLVPDRAIKVGVSPSASQLADVNGDGSLDIVVANRFSGDISVLFNERTGVPASDPCFCESRFRAGSGPYALVHNSGGPRVWSQHAPAGLVARDFDADQLLDLVVVNGGSNNFSVLRGSRNGGFLNPETLESYLTGLQPTVVVAGSFNSDSFLDLAILNEGSGDLSIFLGDGQGGFTNPLTHVPSNLIAPPPPRARMSAGNLPTGLSIHDVNGDGNQDLLVGNEFGDLLTLLGNGDGTFQPYQRADQKIALVVRDLNGDGQDDFVFANEAHDRLSVQYSKLGQTFVQERRNGLLGPGAVSSGDLNRDGQPDLVIANSGANNVLVYLGTGHGQFGSPHSFFAGTNPAGITIQDLNGDLLDDVIVANEGSNDVTVLLGHGRSTDWTLASGPRLRAGIGPLATSVQDMTGDNILDILVSNSRSNDVFLLPGVGGGFFDDRNPFVRAVGDEPAFMIPVNNGVLTVNRGSNDVTFIPSFFDSPRFDFSSGGLRPVAAIMDDFNADGHRDLMVANHGNGVITMLVGDATGLVFAEAFSHADIVHPTALAISKRGNEVKVYVAEEGEESAVLLTSFGIPVPSPTTGEPTLPLTEVFVVTGPGFAVALNIFTTGDEGAAQEGIEGRAMASLSIEGFTMIALAFVLYTHTRGFSLHDGQDGIIGLVDGAASDNALDEHKPSGSAELIRFMIGIDEAIDRSLPVPSFDEHRTNGVESQPVEGTGDWLSAIRSVAKSVETYASLAFSHVPLLGNILPLIGLFLGHLHHAVDALLGGLALGIGEPATEEGAGDGDRFESEEARDRPHVDASRRKLGDRDFQFLEAAAAAGFASCGLLRVLQNPNRQAGIKQTKLRRARSSRRVRPVS